MSDITPPNTLEQVEDFSKTFSSYKGQQPGTFSLNNKGYKSGETSPSSASKPLSVGLEISNPEAAQKTKQLIELGRKAEEFGFKLEDGNLVVEEDSEILSKEQLERESKLESENKALRKLMLVFAKFEVVKEKLSDLYTKDLDQSIKAELLSESDFIGKKIEEINKILDESYIPDIYIKVKNLEDRIEKIQEELKTRNQLATKSDTSSVVSSALTVPETTSIVEVLEKNKWDVLDVKPVNVFVGDNGVFYLNTPSGSEELPDQEKWRNERDNFQKEWDSYINFINSGDTEKKKSRCEKLINLKNEVLDALSDGKLDLAIIKRSDFSNELNYLINNWSELEKKLNPIMVGDKTIEEWRAGEEVRVKSMDSGIWGELKRKNIVRNPGVAGSFARLINRETGKGIVEPTIESVVVAKQVYSPMLDTEVHVDTKTTDEEKLAINVPETVLTESPHVGGMAYSVNAEAEPMAISNSSPDQATEEKKIKLGMVSKLMETMEKNFGNNWRKYAFAIGTVAISAGLPATSEKEKVLTTETAQQEEVVSWFDNQTPENKEFINQIITKTPEEIVNSLLPDVVSPNDPSNVLNMNAFKVIWSHESVYGLDDTRRGQISYFINNLGKIGQIISTTGEKTLKPETGYIPSKLVSENTTIRELIELIKSKIAEANRNNI
jgi:hypothetical protein